MNLATRKLSGVSASTVKVMNTSLESSGMPSDTDYYVDYPPHEDLPEEAREKKKFFLFVLLRKIFRKKKKEPQDAEPVREDPAGTPEPEAAPEIAVPEETGGETEGKKTHADL